ncbi:FAD-linked oxidoreductase [Lentinus tigrinus ALCF2SS1-6]|uniref:Proline dehydrogenase n=1 Tax=Lentinus tigrinus ALCF2SS1-6 TaxID=1328759 RepID=A0A5C2S6X0_9APHY|nr:FAD-linked oxidoreductase [Lentinus tigrinus ALCF2SS1-6]
MSSFALAGRLLSKGRSTAVCTSLSWRARAASTATSTSAPSSPRSRFFSVRRLTALGLVSALGTGTYVFLQDARAGAEEVAALNQRNPVGTTAKRERPQTPLSTLIRTYVVYSFCSVPALVDLAPTILATLSAVPGLKQITEAFVRVTFFDQFVGGDTAEDAIPLIEDLRAQNTGCLFAYSVEVDQDEAAGKGPAQESKAATSVYKQVVRETMHSVDVAADYEDKHTTGRTGRRTWVAIKLSAMAPDAESLRRLSQYLVDTRPRITPPVAFPGCPLPTDLDVLSSPSVAGPLTEADIAALRELREDLIAICARAQERGVRLIFDAEYSWYEPAIDAFTLDMMRLFNKLPEPQTKKSSWFGRSEQAVAPPSESVQPLIYATYQAYLRRTPEYIAQSIAAAREGGYSIGLKLVRGAYHPHEVAAHLAVGGSDGKQSLSISPDPAPPVWTEKADTDARYNACVRELIAAVRADVGNATPTVGVLFGTHNWESAKLIVDELARQGLGQMDAQGVVHVGDEAAERVTMGQLFGMMAVLTNYLVDRIQSSSPFVIKYIPYGQLSEVMPYLSRRAIENKSVLGNGAAQEERRRAAAEILARISG